jgi:hypothetical protein
MHGVGGQAPRPKETGVRKVGSVRGAPTKDAADIFLSLFFVTHRLALDRVNGTHRSEEERTRSFRTRENGELALTRASDESHVLGRARARPIPSGIPSGPIPSEQAGRSELQQRAGWRGDRSRATSGWRGDPSWALLFESGVDGDRPAMAGIGLAAAGAERAGRK